jgi:hypothetical protein
VFRGKRPPTDFELLGAIYNRHRDDFAAGSPAAQVMVPIDIPKIASDLGADVASVFGRLYYHLDPLYGEDKNEEGGRKAFFMAVAGDDSDRVNFPLLEAVFGGLWQQRRRDLWTFWIAATSAGIAIGSLVVSIATA